MVVTLARHRRHKSSSFGPSSRLHLILEPHQMREGERDEVRGGRREGWSRWWGSVGGERAVRWVFFFFIANRPGTRWFHLFGGIGRFRLWSEYSLYGNHQVLVLLATEHEDGCHGLCSTIFSNQTHPKTTKVLVLTYYTFLSFLKKKPPYIELKIVESPQRAKNYYIENHQTYYQNQTSLFGEPPHRLVY